MEAYVDFQVPKFIMLDDGDYLVTVEPKVDVYKRQQYNIIWRFLLPSKYFAMFWHLPLVI